MGMDLKPRRGGRVLSYNWTGWKWLVDMLDRRGVDTSEFRFLNDGDPISAATCKEVAQAIEAELPALDESYQTWLRSHPQKWRESGGFSQH